MNIIGRGDLLRSEADFLDREALAYGASSFAAGIRFSARRLRDMAEDLDDA